MRPAFSGNCGGARPLSVLLDRTFPETPFCSVSTEDETGAVMAVEHLFATGCRRIAWAGVRRARRLIAAEGEGRLSHSFARAVLFGPPNAGKSSLFNAMLRRRRAIVSPHPGTTRDAIEATMALRSLELLLVDTAGLRPSGDGLEEAAVSKSRHSVRRADLALCVLDAAQPPGAETRESLESLPPGRGMIVLNKCDLGPCHPRLAEILPRGIETAAVSAATGAGVKELLELIRKRVESGRVDRSAGELMVSARQAHLLDRALGAMKHLLGEGREPGDGPRRVRPRRRARLAERTHRRRRDRGRARPNLLHLLHREIAAASARLTVSGIRR